MHRLRSRPSRLIRLRLTGLRRPVAAISALVIGLTTVVTIGGVAALPGSAIRDGCANLTVTHPGTSGDDVIFGTNGPDVIATGKGDDLVYGLGGDDVICLGGGDDQAFAGAGDDLIYGGGGIDKIRGGPGENGVFGGSGTVDFLKGGPDNDVIYGGPGHNRIRGSEGDDRVIGGENIDWVWGGPGDDILATLDGDDVIAGSAGSGDVCLGGLGSDLFSASCETTYDTDETLGAATTFGAGTFAVDTEVQPGVYVAPAGVTGCSWTRRVTGTGGPGVSFSQSGDERQPIELLPGDVSVQSNAQCGTWEPAPLDIPDEPDATLENFVQQRVGINLLPGMYVAAGTTDCTWGRFSGLAWFPDGFVQASGRVLADVRPSDVYVAAVDCGTFVPVVDPASPATAMGEGDFRIGIDILPGEYETTATDLTDCSWSRLTEFRAAFTDRIQFGTGTGQVTVQIQPTDGGFRSEGCGSWARTGA